MAHCAPHSARCLIDPKSPPLTFANCQTPGLRILPAYRDPLLPHITCPHLAEIRQSRSADRLARGPAIEEHQPETLQPIPALYRAPAARPNGRPPAESSTGARGRP